MKVEQEHPAARFAPEISALADLAEEITLVAVHGIDLNGRRELHVLELLAEASQTLRAAAITSQPSE